MIKRDYYLNRLIHNMWNGEIKVITGIRRCGKSVLLFDLFYEYLLSQGVKEEQIIRLELDQRRNYKYRNPITLCDYVDSIVSTRKDEKFYLFIDEVQFTIKVKDEENAGIVVTIYDMLNELKAYKNLDVYVTGSNSKMLSKDIATEFRGRATQIHVYRCHLTSSMPMLAAKRKLRWINICFTAECLVSLLWRMKKIKKPTSPIYMKNSM